MSQYNSGNPNAMAVVSLVLGIIALLSCFTSISAILGIICAIIGLILGNKAKNLLPPDERGIATAGWVCSLIALILCGLMVVIVFGFFGLLLGLLSFA